VFFLHFLCALCIFCVHFCVFNNEDNEDFWGAFFAFCVCIFGIFLDIAIDNIGDNQYGKSYNIGNKQYSSKNFSESVTFLIYKYIRF
jgi:hypothetical protein